MWRGERSGDRVGVRIVTVGMAGRLDSTRPLPSPCRLRASPCGPSSRMRYVVALLWENIVRAASSLKGWPTTSEASSYCTLLKQSYATLESRDRK